MDVPQSATHMACTLEPLNHRQAVQGTDMVAAIGMLYRLISHHLMIQFCSLPFVAVTDLIDSQAHRH